ncbi:MFS transporter [Gordonia jinghuaiqii]|uniref:MFS transporter n=1 Tax=Gordonia jinghuaiqii TaxID=2758710 RepID=A0A7D7LXH0_9ACTN|nr:MFS transporter [Gordonia jinghuaiqii]MCR5977509.1 MFS transporter [Gordonia jinghuaiqii]QMT02198.1 MFS transporter [Gordonia jinghuaiqii]
MITDTSGLENSRTASRSLTQRALIALAQVLGLAVWFSASAVLPAVQRDWNIGSAASVWLTTSVQLGFVAGAILSTALNLADRIRPQVLLGISALGAATCTAALAVSHGPWAGIPLRLLTGVFLAGVYPVGMKLMASWSTVDNRGRSLGLLIAALTLGSALPHLISSLGDLPWRTVLLVAATITALGGILALTLIRTGPFTTGAPAAFRPRYALEMFRSRRVLLVNLGYFGHMWELYALWAWLPAYLAARQEFSESPLSPSLTTFLAIGVAGIAGCLAGGWAADRWGRAPAAMTALAISGACCVFSGLFFRAPFAVVLIFLAVWGAAVIADSGVFSASLTEVADARYIGTALTAQTAIGFLLTVVSIQIVPYYAELVGWRYAFTILGLGPIVGVVAMAILRRSTLRTATLCC